MARKKIKRIVRKKKKKKTHPIRRTVVFLLLIGLALVGFEGYNIGKLLLEASAKIDRVDIGQTAEELMINDGLIEKHVDSDVVNIALFGVDARPDDTNSRSDTIMILSIDKENKDIKITSIMRDTYIHIPTEYYTRINAAYYFGGPKLAVQTINTNFDLDITDYITVNFNAIADLVDAVGGIELTITEEEVDIMNKTIKESNKLLDGEPSEYVSVGTQICDGHQVLAYVRIRKLGNGDFDRTARQREVLSLIFQKIKSEFSLDLITNLAMAVSDDISTSLSNSDILLLAYQFYRANGMPEVQALTDESYLKSATIGGSMVLLPYRLEDAVKDMHLKIYGDIDYQPTDTLMQASDALYELTMYEDIYTIDTNVTID